MPPAVSASKRKAEESVAEPEDAKKSRGGTPTGRPIRAPAQSARSQLPAASSPKPKPKPKQKAKKVEEEDGEEEEEEEDPKKLQAPPRRSPRVKEKEEMKEEEEEEEGEVEEEEVIDEEDTEVEGDGGDSGDTDGDDDDDGGDTDGEDTEVVEKEALSLVQKGDPEDLLNFKVPFLYRQIFTRRRGSAEEEKGHGDHSR